MSLSVLPMFPSKSFIVSGLTFRSLIHFGFIFVYSLRRVLISFFYMYLSSFPSTIYWRDFYPIDFPGVSDGKVSAYNAGDPGSIPGWGRSPREGNANPLQYSCLENFMDRGTWHATVHGVTKRYRTEWLSHTSMLIGAIFLLRPFNSKLSDQISCFLLFCYP